MPTRCSRPMQLGGAERLQHLRRRDVERLRHCLVMVPCQLQSCSSARGHRGRGAGWSSISVSGMRETGLEGEAFFLGFSVEPGERIASVKLAETNRPSWMNTGRTDVGDSSRRCGGRPPLSRPTGAPPSAGCVLAHQLFEAGPSGGAVQASGDAPAASCSVPPRASARWSASIGKSRRTVGMRSALAPLPRRPCRSRPAATARSSTRLRARRAASP